MATGISINDLHHCKQTGQKITMVTAYDATFSCILDRAGVDMLLVGDSLGMVMQGHTDTLGVTLDHMVYHTAAVRRGSQRAWVVADMPFMECSQGSQAALHAAKRLMQEGRAHGIKVEGGAEIAGIVRALTCAGVPVMGHVGLMPQHMHQQGGFRLQGRTQSSARTILRDALAMEAAGCHALLLEGIPANLAQQITQRLHIPTIGIGAGPHCDGQVLVCYDLLGMNPDFSPKFLKKYSNLHERITEATQSFAAEVREGSFPAPEHTPASHTPGIESALAPAPSPSALPIRSQTAANHNTQANHTTHTASMLHTAEASSHAEWLDDESGFYGAPV